MSRKIRLLVLIFLMTFGIIAAGVGSGKLYYPIFGTESTDEAEDIYSSDDDDTSADDSSDYEDADTEALENELKDARQNKEDVQELVEKYASLTGDLEEYVSTLDEKIESIEEDLVTTTKQEKTVNEYLEKVQASLEDDKRTEKNQYNAMKLRIKYMYEHGSYTFMDALTGSTSFGDMLNRTTLAGQIQKYDDKVLTNYRNTLASISKKEEYISEAQKGLENIKQRLTKQRDDVNTLEESKLTELAVAMQNLTGAKSAITYYQNAETELENSIAAAEEVYDDGELPEEYTGGKFLWPVPGYYTISSPFGYRIHPIFKTKMLHGGIDIPVPTGHGIYAAAKGTVIVAGYISSSGNYIIVDHGGGLCTCYMHNSKLLVKVGDKVKRGQKIALSGSTGWSTGPHCHFAVRKDGKYVNPIPYLKSTSDVDDSDYSDDEDNPDTSDDTAIETNDDDTADEDSPEITKDDSEDDEYTKAQDDQGDNGSKSSDLKDDSDPDSE